MTGEEVRTIRRGLGLTQSELARWLLLKDDSGWAVRQWETNKRDVAGPTEVALRAFCSGYRPPHVASKDTP